MAELKVDKFKAKLLNSDVDILSLVDEKGYTILHEMISTKIV